MPQTACALPVSGRPRCTLCDPCWVSKRTVVAWLGGLAGVILTGSLVVILHASNDSGRHDAMAPAWTSQCFTRPVSVSSSDLAYIGLTREAADALAATRGQRLMTFGADSHCLTIAGVALARPVAVAFDIGSTRGIPASAKIVFASSDGGAALQGE
jgi:hypothetical protein